MIRSLQAQVFSLLSGVIEPCAEEASHRHVRDAYQITAVSEAGIRKQLQIAGNEALKGMTDRYSQFLRLKHPDWKRAPVNVLEGNLALLNYSEGIRDLIDVLDRKVPRWYEDQSTEK